MPRVRTGFTRRRRHKKILKETKGYYGTRSKLFRRAKEAYIRAGEHAFFGRKLKKRDFRKLWIIRISAALKKYQINYSTFINKLKTEKIDLNRKSLSELAVRKPDIFKEIVQDLK